MPDLDVLIFDWSGTISDDRKPVYEANMRMMERRGMEELSFTEWLRNSKQTAREFFAERGILESAEKLWEEYQKSFGEARAKGINPELYADTREVLQKLKQKGKKLIVVSSHPEKNLLGEAREYGLEEYFNFIVPDVRNKAEKIKEVCETIGVSPSSDRVAYIGDTIYDIRYAKNAGVCAIGITTGYHLRENLEAEKPDKIIDSLAELLDLFK